MLNFTCNIDKSDRINRSIFGIVLILGALFGAGRWFYILFGTIMLVEGIIGWCGIPGLIARLKSFKANF